MSIETVVHERLIEFLEVSGYSMDDILAFNPDTGKISTRNGGLYAITDTGKILHISGPSYDPTDRV